MVGGYDAGRPLAVGPSREPTTNFWPFQKLKTQKRTAGGEDDLHRKRSF